MRLVAVIFLKMHYTATIYTPNTVLSLYTQVLDTIMDRNQQLEVKGTIQILCCSHYHLYIRVYHMSVVAIKSTNRSGCCLSKPR